MLGDIVLRQLSGFLPHAVQQGGNRIGVLYQRSRTSRLRAVCNQQFFGFSGVRHRRRCAGGKILLGKPDSGGALGEHAVFLAVLIARQIVRADKIRPVAQTENDVVLRVVRDALPMVAHGLYAALCHRIDLVDARRIREQIALHLLKHLLRQLAVLSGIVPRGERVFIGIDVRRGDLRAFRQGFVVTGHIQMHRADRNDRRNQIHPQRELMGKHRAQFHAEHDLDHALCENHTGRHAGKQRRPQIGHRKHQPAAQDTAQRHRRIFDWQTKAAEHNRLSGPLAPPSAVQQGGEQKDDGRDEQIAQRNPHQIVLPIHRSV